MMKFIGWLVVGGLFIAATFFSRPDLGLGEGQKGTYLGRMASDAQISGNVARDLQGRAGTQRY